MCLLEKVIFVTVGNRKIVGEKNRFLWDSKLGYYSGRSWRCKEERNEFGMEFIIEEGNDIPFRRMIVEEELHWLEEEEKAELN